MINYHSKIVSALNKILPTYYEMALTSKTITPCISYMEIGNSISDQGDTIDYSRISYQIKVWGNDIEILQDYALQIDSAMRAEGFKRISSGELYDVNSTMIQKILSYECLALENY